MMIIMTHFTLYSGLGENLWDREREGATDHFWLELQNLEPATAYEVRVVSVPKTADEDSTEFKPSLQTRFHTSGIRMSAVSFSLVDSAFFFFFNVLTLSRFSSAYLCTFYLF